MIGAGATEGEGSEGEEEGSGRGTLHKPDALVCYAPRWHARDGTSGA